MPQQNLPSLSQPKVIAKQSSCPIHWAIVPDESGNYKNPEGEKQEVRRAGIYSPPKNWRDFLAYQLAIIGWPQTQGSAAITQSTDFLTECG